jgi:hypothetical protein
MNDDSSPNIIHAAYASRVGQMRKPTDLSRKREGRRSRGTPKRRREAAIKMKIKERNCSFTRFIWLRIEFSDGFFEDGNAISVSIKGKEFLD